MAIAFLLDDLSWQHAVTIIKGVETGKQKGGSRGAFLSLWSEMLRNYEQPMELPQLRHL